MEVLERTKALALPTSSVRLIPRRNRWISNVPRAEITDRTPYTNSGNPLLNGLYKYSFTTATTQQLTTGLNIFNQPKWGKNGWIVFNVINGADREIYKIKSNGDSLKKLTSGHPDLFPEWNFNATKIIFNRATYLASPSSKIFIANDTGLVLDSIDNQYFNFGSCNKLDELACPPKSKLNFGITSINLASKLETLLYNQTDNNAIQGITWHPNGEDVYFTTLYNGLYKVSKTSKQLSLVKSFCTSKSYSFITFSQDGLFMLVERIDARVVNCNPWYKSTIYKVSIDGKAETKIIME